MDRINRRLVLPAKRLHARQVLTTEAIAQQVNQASHQLAEFGSPEWLEQKSILIKELSLNGLRDDLLARAFALVRQASGHCLSMRHHDVQLLAAWAMAQGNLVEMNTGEGKTLTATLAAASAAMAGIPVHVITTNEYLVARDAQEMTPLYEALGLSCAAVAESMSTEQRREAYRSDIVYCTNKQVAFDYLRDRLVMQNESSALALKLREFDLQSGPVLRGLCFAIVDEADSVMIDEASTPLLLSREVQDPQRQHLYEQALRMAAELKEQQDFSIHSHRNTVALTANGQSRLADFCAQQRLNGLWQGRRRREWLVQQALLALHVYKRDQHYLLRGGQIEIIDPNTGRTMPDRAWQQGLHQMVEHKEGCQLTGQRETLAKISYQRFFLRYLHLAGMSGTLQESASELHSAYGVATLLIPTHKPRHAKDCGCRLYTDDQRKYQAIVQRVQEVHGRGQPLLLGTASLASSERLSALLKQAGLAHHVLNARQDADEALVIAGAGLRNAITVATNMAGRGTDIKLGAGVAKLGGLYVIACEPNSSRRIDRQLFGRCGRQGEPGSYELFVSLEDELVSTYYPMTLLKKAQAGEDGLVADFVSAQSLFTRIPQRKTQNRLKEQRRQILRTDQRMDELLAFTGNSE